MYSLGVREYNRVRNVYSNEKVDKILQPHKSVYGKKKPKALSL